MNTIGFRIKQERKRLGLNQTDFAGLVGYSRNAQASYERDEKIPGGTYLQKLAEQGCDVFYILTGNKIPQTSISMEEQKPIKNYRVISDTAHLKVDELGVRNVNELFNRKINMKKQESVSFEYDGKETIKDRLKELLKGRSIRTAAKEWGLPFSTLNNYFDKGTTPSLYVAHKISKLEEINLEWLITGDTGDNSEIESGVEDNEWKRIHDSMTVEERATFTRIVYRHGVSAILQLSDDENIQLVALPSQIKKISLMLKNCPPERLKEISASLEGSEHANAQVAVHDSAQKKVAG